MRWPIFVVLTLASAVATGADERQAREPAPQPNAAAQPAPAQPAKEPSASTGASAASLFDSLDRNRDGYLSAEELWRDPDAARNWIAIDRNRDGRISRDEFTTVPGR